MLQIDELFLYGVRRIALHVRREGVRIGRRRAGLCCKLGEGAARLAGMRESGIICRHLLPNFAGYLIVNVSLDIPGMILAETALSFLGLGLRSPAVSWGVLLQDAQKIRSVAAFPWLIIPALFVVVTVLAFNFVGDGLRDAADPYK